MEQIIPENENLKKANGKNDTAASAIVPDEEQNNSGIEQSFETDNTPRNIDPSDENSAEPYIRDETDK